MGYNKYKYDKDEDIVIRDYKVDPPRVIEEAELADKRDEVSEKK